MTSHCILKKLFGLGRDFGREKKSEEKNTLVYAQVLGVTCRKLNSDKCLLRPPKAPPSMSSNIAQSSQTRMCLWNQSSIKILFYDLPKNVNISSSIAASHYFSKHGCIFQNTTAYKKKAASAIMWQDLPKHNSIFQKKATYPRASVTVFNRPGVDGAVL